MTCLSDLVLDRVIAGETAADPHLATCARCESRLSELAKDRETFLREVWVTGLAVKTKRHVAEAPRARAPRLLPRAVAISLAAGLAAITLTVAPPQDGRLKGAMSLDLVVKHLDGSIEPVLPGDTLAPGEAIRFRVKAPGRAHVAVLGIDAAGAVTSYFPAGGDAPRLDLAGGALLDGSVVLDETLGTETIVAVLCPSRPLAEDLVAKGRAALERAGGDPAGVSSLDTGCREVVTRIVKVRGTP